MLAHHLLRIIVDDVVSQGPKLGHPLVRVRLFELARRVLDGLGQLEPDLRPPPLGSNRPGGLGLDVPWTNPVEKN